MRKNTNGFTIIEILVIIAVIGVLGAISITSFTRIQAQVRDKDRSSKIIVIAEALEKYFEKNGVYPTCESISGVSIETAAAVLGNIDPNALTAPSADEGTNSISCEDPDGDSDTFGYIVTDQNSFSLKYYEEVAKQAQSTDSRHIAYYAIKTPTTPTVSAAFDSGSGNVKATSSLVSCTAGTAQYIFSYRTNDGIDKTNQGDNTNGWTSWSTWASSNGANTWSTNRYISAVTATDGVKYGYRVKARCFTDSANYSMSATSNEGTYTDPIPAPTAPTVSVSTSGVNSTWSWSATSCATGTSPSYRYDFTSTSGSDSGWISTTSPPVSYNTSAVGYTYAVAAQQKCFNSNIASDWSASGTASYTPFSYRSTGVYNSSGSTSAVVVKPAGTVDGDLIFVTIQRAAAVDPSSVPTGWTLVQSKLASYGCWVYYKIASSEGASWTWTWAASARTMGRAHSFYGSYNTSSPIQSSTEPYSGTASGTAIDIPTLTTSSNNTMSLLFASGYSTASKTFSVPANWTEHDDTGNTSPDFWQAIASRVIPASGTATGVVSYPISAASTYRVGLQVMVNMK